MRFLVPPTQRAGRSQPLGVRSPPGLSAQWLTYSLPPSRCPITMQGREGWGEGWQRRRGRRAGSSTSHDPFWPRRHKSPLPLERSQGFHLKPLLPLSSGCSEGCVQKTESHPRAWPSFVPWGHSSSPGVLLPPPFYGHAPCSPIHFVFYLSGRLALLASCFSSTWVSLPPKATATVRYALPFLHCDSDNTRGRLKFGFHFAYYHWVPVLSLVAFAWAIMGGPHQHAFEKAGVPSLKHLMQEADKSPESSNSEIWNIKLC